jgi:hypothetical protein
MRHWLPWFATGESVADGSNKRSHSLAGHASELSIDSQSSLPGLDRLLIVFLGLGILARTIRYYLCFPLWDDESFLCVNFISRSLPELLQPLDYHQVAPVLFLWVERTAVRLLGFSEYALRLVPFLCSIGSLFLFQRVARRLLTGPALIFAVATFAVSYPGIRYAAEAKPYCTDMFVSLLMLSLFLDWYQSRNSRLLYLLALLMPSLLGASYPAVFAAGGLSLVVGSVMLGQRPGWREWHPWVAWNLSIVGSFVFWFTLIGKIQSSAEGEFMGEYWKQNFPPMREFWLLPFWLIKTHASDFLAYPIGGPNWASSLTLIICLAGIWRLTTQKKFLWLGLLLGPAAVHFLAAALQKYPYGGHVKFSQYLAPMICCLIGVGIVQLLDFRSRFGYSSRQGFLGACVILMAIGCGDIVRDLANPFKTRSDDRARAFAKAFWVGTHYAEEVSCLKSDQGLDFVPDQHKELSWSAHYRCNRAIEMSRSRLHPADLKQVSVNRPLRCVLYHDARYELDQASLDKWLDEMKQHYELIAHESIPFPRLAKNERRLVTMEYIHSYKFVPRGDSSTLATTAIRDDAITSH